jgi:hypothetical protein
VLAVFLIGCTLRIMPWTAFDGLGYDESWYRKYLLALDQHGLASYPEIFEAYLEDGKDEQTLAKAPPTRALFIFTGWAWKRVVFGAAPPGDLETAEGLAHDPARISLHRAATLFGCLALLGAWGFARRLLGDVEALGVLALMACSPLLIHMSQHALIDGLFATCTVFALWTLWESLRPEASHAWLPAFGVSFIALVLTKESALFPAFGFAVILLVARPSGLGETNRHHWFTAVTAGLVALVVLNLASGGFEPLLDTYLLFIRKVQALGYAQETGDGPWSRYLVDLMIFTPATLCFAIGGAFRSVRHGARAGALVLFLVATYLAMCNVRYGMNLRYTTIWELPLRMLAVAQVVLIAMRCKQARPAFLAIIAMLCAIDLAQYRQFFVQHRLYELPTADLLRAEKMLK